ncbi:hypothetical protein BBO99_00006308 [Phytophthora kernoviae]|uniref:Uncharacterized protein n=2 Tax=Phytophthora kernoviae TaxID=325452 RepID=A0A421GL58_9STRA|nr:hypothetical protein G195_009715 [Phytophthora kernoviae 00238/432]KAG2511668.1 hypothetical protein JM16_006168 [Phytophthora kernoviae]KAG2515780.1 hypothetical protein JM18_008125 [Phytophthora kernoviae]RLN27023.1 hypothetical protein BBI17_006439 [Phytophthora kernoviae]RLN77992.1 hypothetical protein BBO99_00006308 [Phytophthora kernoviae]
MRNQSRAHPTLRSSEKLVKAKCVYYLVSLGTYFDTKTEALPDSHLHLANLKDLDNHELLPYRHGPARATAPATSVIKTFGKTNLFVTDQATAKAGLLSLLDIFGIDSGYIQQDAEALGKLGYAAVVVDSANGGYKTPGNKGDMPMWLKKYSFDDFARERIADASAAKMTECITVPQLLLSAGNDLVFCEVVGFPDVIHGWVNRGNLEDLTAKVTEMKAWHVAVKFTQTANPL